MNSPSTTKYAHHHSNFPDPHPDAAGSSPHPTPAAALSSSTSAFGPTISMAEALFLPKISAVACLTIHRDDPMRASSSSGGGRRRKISPCDSFASKARILYSPSLVQFPESSRKFRLCRLTESRCQHRCRARKDGEDVRTGNM